MNKKLVIIYTILIVITSCNLESPKKDNSSKDKIESTDSVITADILHTEYNEYLKERLDPIRAIVKNINHNKTWNKTRKIEDSDAYQEYTKTYYLQNDTLIKVEEEIYEVNQQQKNEYYLKHNQLVFAYENTVKYNRPIYYDSLEMKKNNDSVVFDIDQAKIFEYMSYFDNDTLIRQINNQNSGAPFAKEYLLKEQNRIHAEFDKLQ